MKKSSKQIQKPARHYAILVLFFFLFGFVCSIVPLSIHFSLKERTPTPAAPDVQTPDSKSLDPKPDAPIPTTIAKGIMEKMAKVSSQASSLAQQIPTAAPAPTQAAPAQIPAAPKSNPQRFFHIQPPSYLPDFMHSGAGCEQLTVAGQVFNPAGQPLEGLVIVAASGDASSRQEFMGYSGLAEAYGPGGYEIQIERKNSDGHFKLQLFDEAGNSLSPQFLMNLPADCENSLVLVNFYDWDPSSVIYLPLIGN